MGKTRKQRAVHLLEVARRGPSFGARSFNRNKKFQDEAAQAYRLWSTSWLLGELQRLIPELKGVKIEQVTSEPYGLEK